MSDAGYSPPTSPIRYSPPTSPAAAASESENSLSPQNVSSSSSGSPSTNASPVKHGKKRRLCRTSLQRKQRRQDHDGVDMEKEHLDTYQATPPLPSKTIEDHGNNEDIGDSDNASTSTTGMDSTSEDDSHHESDSGESDPGDGSSLASDHPLSERSSATESEEDAGGDSSDGDTEPADLYEGSGISVNEALLKVLKLYVEERMTKGSLDKNIKLIKSLLPQPNELPSSGRAALKTLTNLTSTCNETEHVYCKTCLQLVDSESDSDSDSEGTSDDENSCSHDGDNGKFYSFPIDQQVKHMFEQRGLSAAIDSYREHRSRVPDHICDIVDGAEYLKVKRKLRNIYDLILLWNTDGVALSSSSNMELWIILCTICEVPPRLRSSFVLVAGVYVGEKAPDMNVFLKPFKDSLKTLFEKGFEWIDPLSKQVFVTKIVAPVFSADAPAKSYVLKCKNFNYKYGCLTCEQRTKRIELPIQNVNDPNERPKSLRRFLYEDDIAPAPLRSGPQMDLLGALAKRRGKPRKGVFDKSVVSKIPLSDRALCVSAEYMHLALLGVVKYFLLIIFTRPGPWSMSNKLDEINDFIMNEIRVPDFVNRLPRKVKDLKYWKASELRAFLLFYSLIIFKKFQFPEEFYQHWLLLVSAIHLLLKDAISEDDLNCAEVMLKGFVRDVGQLYGEMCYTYNVHNLLHLCLLVRRWGPLWATSAFPFENFNGFLGANVHGTKHLGIELITNIKISQSVVILENIVNAPSDTSKQRTSELLGKPKTQQQILNDKEKRAIESSGHCANVLHIRARFMSKIYTSRLYDINKKRANSFIHFSSAEGNRYKFGEIIVFFKNADGSLHCLVEGFKVLQLQLVFHEPSHYIVKHILPVEDSGNFLVIPMSCIQSKVLKIGNYIGLPPNSYEVNL